MNKKTVGKIFEILAETNAGGESIELSYINHFTLLVAIVLSAQATDRGVNKATEPLFRIVRTPEEMLDLGEDGLREYIKSINYFNTKTRNVIGLSRLLVEKYDSTVPDRYDDLITLPGVGRKTANVFLSVAFGQPTIGVDTHVFRVSNRIGLTKAKNVEESERQLMKVIPPDYRRNTNHWLVLLGRYTCTARRPKCGECSIAQYCEKNGVELGK